MKTRPIFITFEGGEGSGKTTQIHLLKEWAIEQGHKVLDSREPGGTKKGEIIRAVLMNIKKDDRSDENFKVVNLNIVKLSKIIESSGIGTPELVDYVLQLSRQREITPDLELTLFILCRIAHSEEIIEPFLRGETDSNLLLCDRFWHSSYAYQLFTEGKSFETKEVFDFMNDIFDWHIRYLCNQLVFPRVLLFDVDIDTGLARVGIRGDKLTSYDAKKKSYHVSVRNGFWDLSRNSNLGHSMPRYNCDVRMIDANPPSDVVFQELLKVFESILRDEELSRLAVTKG